MLLVIKIIVKARFIDVKDVKKELMFDKKRKI